MVVITKKIFGIYLAEHEPLGRIMKKDVPYYLWYMSDNFKYCVENDYSTHKVAIHFYECPANTEMAYLTDYTIADHYVKQRHTPDIVFLIDCRLIDLYTILTIWKNGRYHANILTNQNTPLTYISYKEHYCYITPLIHKFEASRARFERCPLTQQDIYIITTSFNQYRHEIRIPIIEIIRFFYLSDSPWNQSLFAGKLADEECISLNLIDYSKSKITYDGVCKIKLRNHLWTSMLPIVARVYLIPKFKQNIFLISKLLQVNHLNSIINILPMKPQITLPFGNNGVEPQTFKFYYTGVKQFHGDTITHYIHKIAEAEYNLPYEKIVSTYG
ncbi:MAG TPA: hypothetical protein VKR58_05145 [Aquella sp.]|nr:hypothetical protein [Aquella sp.]